MSVSSSGDYLSPELEQLLALARAELDRHVSTGGRCDACHELWPCEPACLAAFTLGSL
jgi:hypothetical protein